MFEKFWDTIKAHPYIIGGAAALILLYFLWPSKAAVAPVTTSTSTAADPNADALLAAEQSDQASISVAGLQAGVANNQTAAATQQTGILANLYQSLASIAAGSAASANSDALTLGLASLETTATESADPNSSGFSIQNAVGSFITNGGKGTTTATTTPPTTTTPASVIQSVSGYNLTVGTNLVNEGIENGTAYLTGIVNGVAQYEANDGVPGSWHGAA